MNFSKTVLFLRLSSLGDVILANRLAMRVKEKHPDWHLTWFTEKTYEDIVASQTWVDAVIAWDRKNGGTREYIEHIIDIRKRKFDILLDVHTSDRSSFFAMLSGIPVRYGFKFHYPFAHTTYNFTPFIGDDRNFDNMEKYLCTPNVSLENILPHFNRGTKILALSIGASYEKKQWGAVRWSEFCRLAAEEGIGMILLGQGRSEEECAAEIAKNTASPLLSNLVGKLNMKQLIKIIDLCDMTVSGDTGSLHIARALGKPVAAMFGPTTLAMDYTASLKNVFRTTCPDSGCGHYDCKKPCMETIQAKDVFDCVTKTLNNA
ncbi:MAG: glycosyltransferase family 9 protein [Synergistes sp.]|nr:glycosyltransferase family 9 protein [Synergistes sp.]